MPVPFQGPERLAHITTLQLSRPAGNDTIETGEGGLASAFKPRLRLPQGVADYVGFRRISPNP